MSDFIPQEIARIAVPAAAIFGFLSWLFPGLPRLVRSKLRQRMKGYPKIVQRLVGCFVGLFFLGLMFVYVWTDWVKYRDEKRSSVIELKANAIILSDQLREFAQHWKTNNSNLRPDYRVAEQFNSEFQARLTEVVRALGKRGKRSQEIDLSREFPDARSVERTAEEIRRMANEIKD